MSKPPKTCYSWDDTTHPDVVCVGVTNATAFVALITDVLIEGYAFLSEADIKKRAAKGQVIDNNLLGSVSEFCVYVLRKVHENIRRPFISCFRAPDPLARANFPLV